jgi:hypothetical protein
MDIVFSFEQTSLTIRLIQTKYTVQDVFLSRVSQKKMLWHIHPFLGNDRETNNETTAVPRQQPGRQWIGWLAIT